jgi:predicted PurR-regulated permease PerM
MTDDHRAPLDITHATLSVAFLAVLATATFWVLHPFLTSILWAAIISVAVWPVLIRLDAALGRRRGPAVAIVTTAILLVVFVPVTLALLTILRNAQHVTSELKHLQEIPLPPPPPWLERIPFGGDGLAAGWKRIAALDAQQRLAELTPYMQAALAWFAAKAGSVGMMLFQFLLTTVIAAIVLTNGERVRDALLRFAERLSGQQGREAAMQAGRAIRGVVLGVVVTALLQAAIGGVGLYVAGLPAAGLLTAVMLFLCLAQLGPFLVLAPAVVWLYWSGDTTNGSILLAITLVAGALDNVVRPWLIKRGANLPLVLIFAGVIGGLLAFGIIGLFIGPVVLTIAYTLLAAWVRSSATPSPSPGDANARVRDRQDVLY